MGRGVGLSNVTPRKEKLLRALGNERNLRRAESRVSEDPNREVIAESTHPPLVHRKTSLAPALTAAYAMSIPVSPVPKIRTDLSVS